MSMLKHTSLRLPLETMAAIDAARRKRAGMVSLNTWLAEAVAEKLEREAKLGRGRDEQVEGANA